MDLNPRMESRTSGFMVAGDLRWRVWNGVVADVWNVTCNERAEGHYVSPNPRLFVLLEMEGTEGRFEVSHAGGRAAHFETVSMCFVPARMALTAQAFNLHRIRHLDLHFSENAIRQRFGRSFDYSRLTQERLQFTDARMASIAGLIAKECITPQPFHRKYGESLIDALLALLFEVPPERTKRRTELSRRQLVQTTAFLEAHCFETIRLAELAAMIDLSQTHFSHAFKASTGMPPHRWQMHSRIRKVQEILVAREASLIEVSNIAGFSDQAHFTRVFKNIVGVTPAEWRRQNLS
ncbi:helix-turn-helix domain-containing protein [Manganibacter manganicus]|nr:AraC family transcriptional regulator [Pseudaminobacter manganicus]